jgi:predicted alpha/beta-hydrolase family hydrolase
VVEIDTPQGPARAHVHAPAGADPGERLEVPGALVLGHGAGGGVGAPDLVAVTAAATAAGLAVVLVEQPYRVAGRRVGPRAPALDEAWTAVVTSLRAHVLDAPLVTGGRSAGARTACRTATATGAAGVLCLAFPTRPPGRPDAPSRLPELESVGVPVLVVQGERDPYGTPPAAHGRTVVTVAGDHALRKDLAAVTAAVRGWLPTVLPV